MFRKAFGSMLSAALCCAWALFPAVAASAGERIPLDGKNVWTLSFEGRTIPAAVPGNVELDMLSAGLVDDPTVGNNIYELRKYEGTTWTYRRKFETPKLSVGQRLELWFGGIDCLAKVYVNGKLVGEPENMFIEHSFDVTDAVNAAPGSENDLEVVIRSAVMEAQKYDYGTFSVCNFAAPESARIRKAASQFGWDIMPRLVSAGLWRGVELRILEPSRIKDACWMTLDVDTSARIASMLATVQTVLPFEGYDKDRIETSLSIDGKTVYKRLQPVLYNVTVDRFSFGGVKFWWPLGSGKQPLYTATARLLDADGRCLDSTSCRIGIRTVKLEMDDINPKGGTGKFLFRVNGEPIYIRGTNWVPLDACHSRDAAKYDETLALAKDLNCNMIRCWGGNVYEDTRFFDICDSLGIMIWQDFAMGCNFYPQDDSFANAIYEEVKSVAIKLRNHPSLALWSGNNEDDLSFTWALKPYNIDPNRDEISRRAIPKALYEFDPSRPYLPSSPYYSQAVYEAGGGQELLPEDHLWGERGYYKKPFYNQAKAAFVSEIGYHGCPSRSSLEKMFDKDCVYPWSSITKDPKTGEERRVWNDEWLTKSVRVLPQSDKTEGRDDIMLRQVKLTWGVVPTDLDSFIIESQTVEAEAMKYFIELFRASKFEKSGMIWWNLRDGWPLTSEGFCDYYGSLKRAYYFVRNVQRDVCVMALDPACKPYPQSHGYPIVAVNDTRSAVQGSVTVTDLRSGKRLLESRFRIPANGKTLVGEAPVQKGQGMLLISYTVDGTGKFGNHYLYGEPPFEFSVYKELLDRTKLFDNE